MAIWSFIIGLAGLIIFSVIENRRYAKKTVALYRDWLKDNRHKLEDNLSSMNDNEIDYNRKKPEMFLLKDEGDNIIITQLNGDYKNTISKKSYIKLKSRFKRDNLVYSYSWNSFSVYIKLEDIILQFKYSNPILIPKREQ